jgi:CheY-like chemotaxis protein
MNRTVLYIEDDAMNITLVERIVGRLPETGYEVARTGGEGVTIAVDVRPALILLDNHLPDATGTEVLARLAGQPATARIPVIIISGDAAETVRQDLLAAGASEFVVKPFKIDEFTDLINRYLPAM